MKKFQVLATIASATALSGAIAFGVANPAAACPLSNGASKSGIWQTFLGLGGNRMSPPNHAAIAFTGIAGILGLGAGYMSCRAGQQAKAACAAMTDSLDDIDEPEEWVADELGREHPEAPGGEFDLVTQEVASDNAAEKQVAIAK
ncbi:MAG TPA: hypothetical protein VK211_01750 [Kamptonema sp.]|nr:hypothetical protein [Kamptonema sp.]